MHDINYRKIVQSNEQNMIDFNYDHHIRMGQNHAKYVDSGQVEQIINKDYASYEKILSNVPECESCLELGSGGGRQFDVLSTKFKKITGIEIHKPSVEIGQQNGLDIIESTLENTPFGDNTFDVICSRHVMEHTYDIQKALKEIKRILKPEGYVCAISPHYFPDSEIAHITQLGMNEWIKEYENAGFKVIHSSINYYNCEECHIVARKEG